MIQFFSFQINFYSIFWYFIFYSFLGLVIEMSYCFLLTGRIESRKGLRFTPFCPLYGVAAAILIPYLTPFLWNPQYIFIGGAILGSLIEYWGSFFMETVFHAKWWNYEKQLLNINGRICLLYSVFWGLLSIALMYVINPRIDQFIAEIPMNYSLPIMVILSILIIFDSIITYQGLHYYYDTFVQKRTSKLPTSFYQQYFSPRNIDRTFPNAVFILEDNH